MKKLIVSDAFSIIILSMVLIPQIAHSLYLFVHNSHYENPWFGWCYAIGVDVAILIFTVHGWIRTALVFFVATLATNFIYQFWPESIWSGALIDTMLAVSILTFSHLFYSKIKAQKHGKTADVPQASAEALAITSGIAQGIRFEAQPYKCPACGESFPTSKKLNGHVSGHKQKSDWNPHQYGKWEQQNAKRALLAEKINSQTP